MLINHLKKNKSTKKRGRGGERERQREIMTIGPVSSVISPCEFVLVFLEAYIDHRGRLSVS